MSVFAMLMIGGWTTAVAMFGLCAVKESGKLLEIHKRIGLWVETSASRLTIGQTNLQSERRDVA